MCEMHSADAVKTTATSLLLLPERACMDSETKQSQEGEAAVKPALRMEIESLGKVKTKELKARYRDLFGEESPSSNRSHLFRRIAWRLQANAEGDLSERVRGRPARLLHTRRRHKFSGPSPRHGKPRQALQMQIAMRSPHHHPSRQR